MSEASAPRAEPRWVWLLLVAIAVLPTVHRFRNGFVWDDVYVIERGTVVHDPRNLPRIFANRTMYASSGRVEAATPVDTYRPVTLTAFMVDSLVGGRRPWPFHVSGLALHAAVVLLLWRLARRLLPERDRDLAPWAAAFFAVQPQLAEAQVYINGRSDLLATFFGLSAVLAWRIGVERAREREQASVANNNARSPARFSAVSALFLCGLLSKEVLVGALPAIALWPNDGDAKRRAKQLGPFAVAVVLYALLRANALGGVRAGYSAAQWGHSLARLGLLWLDALVELVLPTRVHLRSLFESYGAVTGMQLALAWAGALALFALAYRGREKLPLGVWGLVWFAGPLAPVAAITSMDWLGFGRYLYLPAVGVSVIVAALLARARASSERAQVFSIARGAVVLAMALMVPRLAVWTGDFRSEEALYGATMQDDERSSVGYGYLGLTLYDRGDCERALPLLSRARGIEPRARKYWAPLGMCELRLGYRAQARRTAEMGARMFALDPQVRAMVAAVRAAGE